LLLRLFLVNNKDQMRAFSKILLVLFSVGLFLVVSFAGAVLYFSQDLPSIEQISSRQVSQSTKIYDKTGTVLLYEISNGRERTVVSLGEIPKYLRDATISIEDEKFYEEPGFDWKAILRALIVNLEHGRILQGGSTITQQLAKNAFLTSEQTFPRKIKEFILAIKLDSYYSKDKILELYLNEIPYGPTIYGVEAASEAYFGKPVRELNLAQSALIAAIPKAPTYYSPWGSHTKELLKRQQLILNKMLSLGKITKKEFDKAMKFSLVFSPQGRGLKAPHFVMAVQDYLAQKYGDKLLREGGLKVKTTLDWDMQQAAERVVSEGALQNEKLYNGKNAALVAEDPKTGQILVLVGSRDYFDVKNDGNFDVATQGLRQPGSALKPFVYLTAFEKGYTPDTVVFDAPTEFAANNPLCPPEPDFTNNTNSSCFHPENFDGEFRGPVSLKQALAQSINIPSVKVLYLAGLEDSVKNAYKFGLTTLTAPNLYGLSLVLGGGAVKLIDLVEAYSVLSQEGVKHDQSMILEVKDSLGRTLESYNDQNERVTDQQITRVINNILSDPDARRGLFQNSLGLTVFPGHDVALKTGTSNDYRDAWALGYTPSIVVGVWAGNNDNSPMQRRGSSILAAVPIWHNFMTEVVKSLPNETFIRPEPMLSQKPILAGDYLYNKQIHSILFYVGRRDPVGPQPQNPTDDPQFKNWEFGVLSWAEKNLQDFKDYNQLFAGNATSSQDQASVPPKIEIKGPLAGSFVNKQVDILAKITATAPISLVKVFWNSQEVQEFTPNTGISYDFSWSFTPANSLPQNLLEVEAVDANKKLSRTSIIVYAQ